MKLWTCAIAGGPDHGCLVCRWVDNGRREPYTAVSSDGAGCPVVVVAPHGPSCYAVFMHPSATPGQLREAEKLLRNAMARPDMPLEAIGPSWPRPLEAAY
jgi:hypothetical protein